MRLKFCFNRVLKSSFWFTAKLSREYKGFSHIPCLPKKHDFSPLTPHHNSTFGITGEPALTQHHHPESMVCVKVHSWCSAFLVFSVFESGQMYNDVYSAL